MGLIIRTVVCKDCGLVYTNPRLDTVENKMFYQHFYKIFFRGEEWPSVRHVENQNRKARLADKYLRDNGLDINQVSSVLDVGCSAGGMLDYFRSCGVSNLIGIEPSVNFAEFARNEFNLEVYTTTLEDFLDENVDRKFDLVIMRDVIEHLLDPKKVLNTLQKYYMISQCYLLNQIMCLKA